MTNAKYSLLLGGFMMAVCAAPAYSQTVVRETVTTTETAAPVVSRTEVITTAPAAHVVRVSDFDLKSGGVLSFREVARMLFKVFDTNGNEVIDNNEYEKRALVSLDPAPVKTQTVYSYDYDGDGVADVTKRTYETFLTDSRLVLFGRSADGISAHDFTGEHFNIVDVNNDFAIDMKEWEGTYIASIDRENRMKAGLNNK